MQKKLFALFILFCTTVSAAFSQSNAIVKYFKPYLSDNRFKSTYISNAMFETILKTKDGELDKETKDILKDLTSMHVLTSENNNPANQYNEAIKLVNTSEYPLLFSKQDQVDKFSLYTKKEGDQITEMLLIARDRVDFVILSFTGKIGLQKMARLGELLHFQGSEFLEEINMTEDELRKTHIPGSKKVEK